MQFYDVHLKLKPQANHSRPNLKILGWSPMAFCGLQRMHPKHHMLNQLTKCSFSANVNYCNGQLGRKKNITAAVNEEVLDAADPPLTETLILKLLSNNECFKVKRLKN